jgi:uncharacterized protein (TIGR02646 family)
MRRFERAAEPAFLAKNWETWGLEWERRRAANPKAQFHWHQTGNEATNQKLLPLLKSQTQNHCSFCDNFPVSSPSIDTIEHFRPKSAFPREAYHWPNLYYCCAHCQQKGDEFDEALLRPDAEDYSFDRFFRWDFTRGTIEVNGQASQADQRRASVTIELYRFNHGHPAFRKMWLIRRAKCKDEPLDEWPYRDYVGG